MSETAKIESRPEEADLLPVGIAVATVLLIFIAGLSALVWSNSPNWAITIIIAETVALIGFLALFYQRLGRQKAIPVKPTAEIAVPVAEENRVLAEALRDAYAINHGVALFTRQALLDLPRNGKTISAVRALLHEQHILAESQAQEIKQHLNKYQLKVAPLRNREMAIAAWAYSPLISDGLHSTISHAAALTKLTIVSYRLAIELADYDLEIRSLLSSSGARLQSLLEDWQKLTRSPIVDGRSRSRQKTIATLLDDSFHIERRRAHLAKIAEAHAQKAADGRSVDEGGLGQLLMAIISERGDADKAAADLLGRLEELERKPSRGKNAESFVAQELSAMHQHLRGLQIARDVRDLLAINQLAQSHYQIMHKAAVQAKDRKSAQLARALLMRSQTHGQLFEGKIKPAVNVTLLTA